MQIVIPTEDVASGASSPGGQPASWSGYYGSSTPTAPLSDWTQGLETYTPPTDNSPLVAAGAIGLLILAVMVGRH